MPKKVSKWLIVLLVVLVLCVAGFLFLHFYFSKERITAWVSPPLEEYLHRKISITNARLGLRGFRVQGFEVRKEGASSALITGERLDLHWNLKALFKGRIEIQGLVLDTPIITLVREADGSLSIADLLPRHTSDETAAAQSGAINRESQGVPLVISLLSTKDGRLTFVDRTRTPQESIALMKINSQVSDLSKAAPCPFRVEGQIESEGQGSFKVEGTVDLATTTVQAKVDLTDLDLAGLSPYLTGDTAALRQGRLALAASLGVQALDRFKTQGTVKLADLKVSINQQASQAMNIEASFAVDGTRSQQVLDIAGLHLLLNGQECKIHGRLSQWQQRPYLEFAMTSPSLKLDDLLELLPSAQSAPELTESTVSPAPSELESKPLSGLPRIQLDKLLELLPGVQPSSKKAESEPTSTPATEPEEIPSVGKQDEEQAPAAQAPATAEAETSTESIPAETPAPSTPFQFDAKGEILLDWFYYRKLVASNVVCNFTLQSGNLQVEPLSASLYGGALEGTVQTTLDSPGPPFQSRFSVNNVLLDELVRAFSPDNAGRYAGNITLTSRAEGTGAHLDVLLSQSDVSMSDAKFSTHPLVQKLAELFGVEDLQRLHFTRATGRIDTKRGVATIQDLHMEGPVSEVEGGGTVGLLDRKLDLRLLMRLPVQYAGKLVALSDLLTKLTDVEDFTRVPLNVSGTLDEPVYTVDERWLQEHLKKAVRGPLKELKEKLLPQPPPSGEGTGQPSKAPST